MFQALITVSGAHTLIPVRSSGGVGTGMMINRVKTQKCLQGQGDWLMKNRFYNY